jgi:hypothetical protein
MSKSKKPCDLEGCSAGRAPGRKLCYKHYGQARRSKAGFPAQKLGDVMRGLELDDVGDVKAVWIKTAGEDRIAGLSVLVSPPKDDSGSPCSEVQPATPVRITLARRKPAPQRRVTRLLFLTDTQTGYRETDAGLEAFHDESAMSVTLQLADALQPDIIVHGGDDIDFPQLSRFAREPGFSGTLKATLDRRHRHLAELRALVPGHAGYQIEGNHEVRLPSTLAKMVPELANLRPANSDGPPLLSVPRLLRLDEVGVTFVSGYPAAELRITPKLRVIHGRQSKSNGSTADIVVRQSLTNTLYGHTHRAEYASIRLTDGTPRWAASPGTLARVDGAVPSFHGAVNLSGASIRRWESWTQGACVVEWEGDGDPVLEMVTIEAGRAVYRGSVFTAETPATPALAA